MKTAFFFRAIVTTYIIFLVVFVEFHGEMPFWISYLLLFSAFLSWVPFETWIYDEIISKRREKFGVVWNVKQSGDKYILFNKGEVVLVSTNLADILAKCLTGVKIVETTLTIVLSVDEVERFINRYSLTNREEP